MKRCLEETDIPEWMNKGKTTLIKKDIQIGTAPNNYRPITCLPIMWKNTYGTNQEEIYYSLIRYVLFPEENKGRYKETIYILINTSLKTAKPDRRCIFSVDWQQKGQRYSPVKLDNRMSSNVQVIRRMYKVYRKNYENCCVGTDRRMLAEVKIQVGIFQGESLSPLLFVKVMTLLNHIFRKSTGGYKLGESQEKINHRIYLDGIKRFAKNK